MRNSLKVLGGLALALALTAGCKKKDDESTTAAGTPVFKIALSPYPSWSAIKAAEVRGLFDGAEGKQGTWEKKYDVDIVVKYRDYDPTLQEYANGQVDAVAVTNTDVANLALKRDTVAFLPTSTSFGGDRILVTDAIKTWDDLKGTKIYGLAASVSEYAFYRCAEANGKNPDDYEFVNQDPLVAATAMQQKDANHKAIVCWNPEAMQVLKNRPTDVRVLCDSTSFPNEIIDMLVIGKDSLAKPGADRFVKAIIGAFYGEMEALKNPATHDEALAQVGKEFYNVDSADMETAFKQTKCYATADEGVGVFASKLFGNMEKVLEINKKRNFITEKPTLGFDDPKAQLNFDKSYMVAVKDGK